MSDSAPHMPESMPPASNPQQQTNVLAAIIVAVALLLAGLMSWHPWSGDPEPRMTTITKTSTFGGLETTSYKVDCVQAREGLSCDWANKSKY